MSADYEDDYGTPAERSEPSGLEQSIRTVICTSESPEDLAGRVQQAIGEYASASDELHVSHAIGTHPQTGLLLYSALIVLIPGRD